MNFLEIARARQSCRSYDADRSVEQEKLDAVIEAGRLAPSACNAQPYHFTVCRGQAAKEVAEATVGMGGMNKFAADAPVMIVISERPYPKAAELGAKKMGTDYRSIDMGIATAYMTAEAAAQGLSTCIIGWIDNEKVMKTCSLELPARVIIALGYAKNDPPREKSRKDMSELVSVIE